MLRMAVLAPALGLLGCRSIESAPAGAGREEVVAVLRAQEAAWNRGDLREFMEGYLDSPDITFFAGANEIRGRAAVLERYQTRYLAEGKEMGRLDFGDLRVEVLSPSSAIARGRWRLRTSREELGGLFTLLFRKSPTGWRIVHDHTSSPSS